MYLAQWSVVPMTYGLSELSVSVALVSTGFGSIHHPLTIHHQGAHHLAVSARRIELRRCLVRITCTHAVLGVIISSVTSERTRDLECAANSTGLLRHITCAWCEGNQVHVPMGRMLAVERMARMSVLYRSWAAARSEVE